MKLKKIFLLSLLVLLLIGVSYATEANNDTTTVDTPEEIVKDASSTTSTVDTTVKETKKDKEITKQANINKTTKTASKTYDVEDFDTLHNVLTTDRYDTITINIKSNIKLTDNTELNEAITKLTIRGNGKTVDGQNNYQFLKTNSNVTIKNIKIINCNARKGGAISNDGGTLTIYNSIFKNNNASWAGGVIYNTGELSIYNSIFNNNMADYCGAIYNTGELSIYNSIFNNNMADDGGAISNEDYAKLSIYNSTFNNNKATRDGGAIIDFGTLTITNSTLNNNSADRRGGAIYSNSLTITDSTLNNNYVNGDGGAIYNWNHLTITDTTLNNNYAGGEGGAIYNYENLIISNVTFINHYASSTVLYICQDNTLNNLTFIDNYATEAIIGSLHDSFNPEYLNLEINNTKFINNNAKHLFSPFLNLRVSNSQFIDNLPLLSVIKEDGKYNILLDNDPEFINRIDISVYVDGVYDGRYDITNNILNLSKTLSNGKHEISLKIKKNNTLTLNIIIKSSTLKISVSSYSELFNKIKEVKNIIAPKIIIDIKKGNYNTNTIYFFSVIKTTNLIVNGNNSKFNGQNKYCFMTLFSGCKVTLEKMTLTKYSRRAIINHQNNLTINNIRFINNTADYGEAILNYGTVTIYNSTFNNNTATVENSNYGGGTIYNNYGNLTIKGCNFTQNRGVVGAVIYNNYGTITITNTSFMENSAGEAGAIYNNGGTLIVNNTKFIENSAGEAGEAGAIKNYGQLIISNSTFNNNYAGTGGAITNSGGLQLINTNFIGNRATFSFWADDLYGGGAIDNGGEISIINHCRFENNSATYTGGAIKTDGIDNLNINDTLFLNNNAGSSGGAIYSLVNRLTITNSTLTKNTATHSGGAIYAEGESITLYDTTLNNNTAGSGGAIASFGYFNTIYHYTNDCIVTINNCTLNNNNASAGGAIYTYCRTYIGYYGVDYTTNCIVTINNCTLNNNKASGGGAISNNGKLTIIESTLQNNAADNGGAINNYATLNITNSALKNNKAKGAGGAIYNEYSDNVMIIKSSFTRNQASNGGAISQYESSLIITDSTLTNNNATNGGAVSLESSNIIINKTNFVNNTAKKHGGAIYNKVIPEYNQAGGYTIIRSSFNNNKKDTIYNYDKNYFNELIINSQIDGEKVGIDESELQGNEKNVRSYKELIRAVRIYELTNYDTYTVNLMKGNYNVTGAIVCGNYNKTLIINGNGITLNGQNKPFIHILGGYTVSLENIILTNFTNNYMGFAIINNEGNLTIINSTINNNTVSIILSNIRGGNLTITDTIIKNNIVNDGELLDNVGTLTITDSIIKDTILNDGRLLSSYRTLNITKSKFINNPIKFIKTGGKYNLNLTDYDNIINTKNITVYINNKYDGTYDYTDYILNWNKKLPNGQHNITLKIDNNNTITTSITASSSNIERNVSNYNELINTISEFKNMIAPKFIINLKKGNYNATSDIKLDGFIINNINLIIKGNGITLNGQNKYNFIEILEGDTVSLENMILTNFSNEDNQRAIYNEGNLTITNSTLNNNSSIYNDWFGGTLTIYNSTFNNNNATRGGAICNDWYGTLTIYNSTFNNNTASSGGAIYNGYDGTVTIYNSTFNNNTSTGEGGAIYNTANMLVDNNLFITNKANSTGKIIVNVAYAIIQNNTNDETYQYSSTIYTDGDDVTIINNIFDNGKEMTILTINKISDVKLNNTVTITGKLTDDTGKTLSNTTVNIKINGKSVNVKTNSKGVYKYTTKTTIVGLNNITVIYKGDINYLKSSNKTTFRVKQPTWIKIASTTNVKYGSTVKLVGRLLDGSNAVKYVPVNVTVNGKTYKVKTDGAGYIRVNHTVKSYDIQKVTFKFAGNTLYAASSNSTAFKVKQPTWIKIATMANVKYGSTVKLVGRLLNGTTPVKYTLVNVTVNGKTYKVKTDGAGYIRLNYTVKNYNDQKVTFKFAGNSLYLTSSNSTVFKVKQPTWIKHAGIGKVKQGSTVKIVGRILYNGTNSVKYVPVNVTVNGKVYKLKTDGAGYYRLNYTAKTLGTITFTSNFAGNTLYLASTNSTKFTVVKS